MESIDPFVPKLWDGFLVTVEVTMISLAFALPIAVLLGVGRLANQRAVRLAAGLVVEFFRGTSAIVQLFWVFFALPLLPLEISVSPLEAAVVVLSLNVGSYTAEVVRGAIQAIPRGQHEAAVALNLSAWTHLRRVTLPQALPMMLPPFGTAAVDLAKASALVGFISVEDLTFWAEQTRLATGEVTIVYAITLAAYFAFAVVLSGLFNALALLTPLRRAQRRAGARSGTRAGFRIFSEPLPELGQPPKT